MDIYEVIKKLAVECSEKDEKVKTAQEKLAEAETRIAELEKQLEASTERLDGERWVKEKFAKLYWRAAQKLPEEKECALKEWGEWYFDTL